MHESRRDETKAIASQIAATIDAWGFISKHQLFKASFNVSGYAMQFRQNDQPFLPLS